MIHSDDGMDSLYDKYQHLKVENETLREVAEVALECLENGGFGKAYAQDLLRQALTKEEQ